jgi:hypothetical protein
VIAISCIASAIASSAYQAPPSYCARYDRSKFSCRRPVGRGYYPA